MTRDVLGWIFIFLIVLIAILRMTLDYDTYLEIRPIATVLRACSIIGLIVLYLLRYAKRKK